MHKIVISDASCLILLQKIDALELLHAVYDSVITTSEVAKEYMLELPKWIIIEKVVDTKYKTLLATQIDLGEASAIALATEKEDSLLLLDDLKARKLAKKLKLNFTGTLGVIIKAKKDGKIDKVKPVLEKILQTNFRISRNIIDEILKLNNE